MKKEFYPEMIRSLPEADIDWKGLRGWLVQNDRILVSIVECDEPVEVGEHVHGSQFGVVISGTLEFIIDGVPHSFEKGDTYYIPAGVKHSARLSAGHRAIDFFEDIDRYKAKS